MSKGRNHCKITKDNFAALCDMINLIASQMAEADYRYLLVIEFKGRTLSYGPIFPSLKYSLSAKREDHKSKGEKRGSRTYSKDSK